MTSVQSAPDPETIRSTIRALVGWTEIGAPGVGNLDQILGTVVDDQFPGAIIPVLMSGSGMRYYAVSRNELEWRSLHPLISAAVGITYSDFTGISSDFVAETDLERVIVAAGYSKITKFSAHGDRALGQALAKGLLRLVQAVKSRPAAAPLAMTTTAQMITEFDLALGYRDRIACEVILSELSDQMRLDAMNIWFLRTRLHARFSEWEELANESYFQSLAVSRRPDQITSDLIEAIYRTQFFKFERADNPQGAIDLFRRRTVESAGTLFTSLPSNPSPNVIKAFVIGELAQAKVNQDDLARLCSYAENWPATEKNFLESLQAIVGGSDEGLDGGEKEAHSKSLDSVRLAIYQAIDSPSSATRESAISLVTELSEADREVLFVGTHIKDLWQNLILADEGNTSSPASWEEWIEIAPTLPFLEARQFAESAVDTWPIGDHLRTAADVDNLVAVLNDPGEDALAVIYQALPFMVHWMKSDEEWPNLSYAPVYRQLLFLLLFGEGVRKLSLVAIADLFTALLQLNAGHEQYTDVLSDLTGQISIRATNEDIDWLVDMSELTIALPCPDSQIRDAFLGAAALRFNELSIWATEDQTNLFRALVDEVGLADLIPHASATGNAVSPAETGDSYQGVTIGIYTLTQSVGQRAAILLESTFDGITISLNSDKTNTRQLNALAGSAELFVICWNSAKHSATTAILDARRPNDASTVYATGTSSIVRVVTEHLATRELTAV